MGAKPSAYGKSPQSNLSVVVAEGEPLLRQGAVDLLERLGFQNVAQVSNGPQAVNLLKRGGVDLVLCGWNLPEGGGLGLIRAVRGHRELFTLPVVVLVQHITTRDVVKAGRAGVTDIVLLPLSGRTLLEKITQVMDPRAASQRAEVSIQFHRGQELMQGEDWEKALACFQRVTETFENAEAYYNMGYIKAAQERYNEAVVYFRRATELDSTFAQAYRQMAKCYQALGDNSQAENLYTKAADLFLENQLDDTAEELLQEVLKLNPNVINVYNSLGIIYRRRGDHDRAVRCYHKALKVNPRDENIYYNMAYTLLESKKPGVAAKILEKALELRPDFPEAQNMMRLLRNLGTSAQNA
ncbi:MAG: tetratricopeptide repeat protein [Deltaproteobacteria bacterium]|nr:tetratricopeptide repeat protein [Deltaproteobacteria bacterium]